MMSQALLGVPSNIAPSAAVMLTSQHVTRYIGPAGWQLNANYSAESMSMSQHAYSALYSWRISGTGADYQVRATLTGGGSVTTGTVGTWLALTTTRTWTSDDSVLLIEIRRVSDSVVLASATIDLMYLEPPAGTGNL